MADGLQGLDNVPLLQFDNTRLNARTFLNEVAHFAAFLHAAGVRRGDVVTLCSPNIPMAVVAFYAINYLGAVVGVVHPLSPPRAVLEQMRVTHSRWLVCWQALCARNAAQWMPIEHIVPIAADTYLDALHRIWRRFAMGGRQSRAPNVHRYNPAAVYPLCAPHQAEGNEVALYLPSGGTMGQPKTVVVHNAMLNRSARATALLGGCLTPIEDSMLMLLPIFHGFGIGVCMHTALSNGVRLVLVPHFRPQSLVRLMVRQHITYMAAIPRVYTKLLATGQMSKCTALKAAYCGGDVLPIACKQQWDETMRSVGSPCRLYQGYGLAETVAVCCANSPTADRLGSIGRPVMDTTISVRNQSGAVACGQVGELCIAGNLVMHGYLQNTPDGVLRTEEDTVWLHTGDMGYCDADGYFYFCGRKKRISIIGGVNVYHQQVEAFAMSVSGVSLAACIECSDKGKPYIRLYLVADADALDNVKALFADVLTRYAIPRQIVLVHNIPLTSMGKVDYSALQKMANN